MPLYLDTSALVASHVDGPAREVVLRTLEEDEHAGWCTSAVTMAEALALIDRLTDEAVLRSDLEDAVRLLWDRLHVVPVDNGCIESASRLMRDQPILLADAIHLAAATRLPRPVRFLTFDPAQIPIALSLGLDVVSL
jgi:predicted nucleic acid-binding protein